MAFIKDLYHDEICDGWLVKSDMKKIWNRQLEIWAEVDRICRKHDITYWAGYGTLLGAARHGGYIPWDEDIDLCMMRPDFNRFCDVVDSELGDSFAVGLKRFSVLRISHEQTTLLDLKNILDENSNGLMIEIFPLDVAIDGTNEGFFATNALNELMGTIYNFPAIAKHVQGGGKTVNDWNFIENLHAVADFDAQWKILNVYAQNSFEQSSAVFWIEDTVRDMRRPTFRKSWFRETIYLPFETVELPAPKMFDEILTSYYGDWRTPVRDGQNRLGVIYSADIPWREFLQHIDLKLLFEKH